MLRVKGQLMLSRNADLASEHAFGERAACSILQRLHDPTEPIHKTSHARVSRANHRTARLNAPKNRVYQMLLRTRRMQKPAVVRNVDEQVRTFEHKLPRQFADRIFKTNQRRDLDVTIRQAKYRVIFARIKIAGHPPARRDGEKRK